MQTASAFGRVQGALSFFVEAYPQLAEWKSVVERLSGFEQSIVDTTDAQSPTNCIETRNVCSIRSDQLVLKRPDRSVLLNIGEIKLEPGETTLLVGPSGTGKSTLLRTLAGIWPFADGRIEMPRGAQMMMLPQRPYLPHGTLRDAITYPQTVTEREDRRIVELLAEVGLSSLAEKLSERAHWQHRLSLGEQQRLTIVRAILMDADWLFLDEATASLDESAERRVYELLRRRLPNATIVSVGHRSTLHEYHRRSVDIMPRREGTAKYRELAAARQ
jgi:putative ATP-binding cassette transporter